MIVKVLPVKPAGTGRPLGTYILDLKHEHPGERLGPYVSDPKKDKVEWARTVNTDVDDSRWAITAIERHNAQNLRAHKVSRWVHIVVSFSNGERPARDQMEMIEDRLMEAIGFGDHPRLSAVHHNTDHRHLHIAVSRIDPTTLKAEHPRHNYFKLQAEAARLEIDLGLRRERKTVLSRERQEIDFRARARDHQPILQESDTMADDDELSKPQRFPLTGDREEAQRITFPATINGRIVDQDIAAARYSDARSERSQDRALVGQSSPKLYERYQAERAVAVTARQEAVQEVYGRFAAYQQKLRGFYHVQHEQQKLLPQRGTERHQEHELLKARERGNRVEAQRLRSQQIAQAKREQPIPTWDKFLEREAGRGDQEAARILQQRQRQQQQEKRHEVER